MILCCILKEIVTYFLRVRQVKSSKAEQQNNLFIFQPHFNIEILPKNATKHPVAWCSGFNRQIRFQLDFQLPQNEIVFVKLFQVKNDIKQKGLHTIWYEYTGLFYGCNICKDLETSFTRSTGFYPIHPDKSMLSEKFLGGTHTKVFQRGRIIIHVYYVGMHLAHTQLWSCKLQV